MNYTENDIKTIRKPELAAQSATEWDSITSAHTALPAVSLIRKGHRMHPFVMAIATATQMFTPVSDAVPKLNVEATCRGSVEADKEMGLSLPQSFDKCMKDENSAREQLGPIWSSYPPTVRTQCEGEAISAGEASYVDLLTCLQMNDGSVATSVTTLRGASKKKRTSK